MQETAKAVVETSTGGNHPAKAGCNEIERMKKQQDWQNPDE